MNYFTPKWCNGDVDEHPAEKYQNYLAPLLPSWPSDIRMLASSTNLHDGLIRKFTWDTQKGTLFLSLRCGDLQVGYFDLDLHYSGVLFSPLDWVSLLTLTANKNSSALYDEVDKEAGQFVHRILFIAYRKVRRSRRFRLSSGIRLSRRIRSPRRFRLKSGYSEIAIRFKSLRLVTTPRESRFDVN